MLEGGTINEAKNIDPGIIDGDSSISPVMSSDKHPKNNTTRTTPEADIHSNSIQRYFVNWTACERGTRPPGLPFVTGDGFRCLADVILDETKDHAVIDEVTMAQLSAIHIKGAASRPPIVFVKSDLIDEFFQLYHDRISAYVLITHNSDIPLPQMIHIKHLESQQLLHWFAQNTEYIGSHPKLTTIPIGFENVHHGVFSPETLLSVRQQIRRGEIRKNESTTLAVNFSPDRTKERQDLWKEYHDSQKPWVSLQSMRPVTQKAATKKRNNGRKKHNNYVLITIFRIN